MFLFKRNSPNSLINVDQLYKNVISKLPIVNRIKYCESLMYRTTEDISNSKYRFTKRKLKKLLKATEIELKKLNN
jgi:hypothetical protein